MTCWMTSTCKLDSIVTTNEETPMKVACVGVGGTEMKSFFTLSFSC